jgi:hypothetical protein
LVQPNMSNAPWYYAKGGRQLGPFTLTQLRQFVAAGVLLPTDLVWETNARDAVPASSVPALFAPSARPTFAPPQPADPASAPKASPMRKWALEYAGVGAVGAVASLFSADVRATVLVAALAAGGMCFVAASSSSEKVPAIVFGLLRAIVGAVAGAITFAIGVFVIGIALSAAIGAGAGLALGSAMTAVNRGG